MSEVTLTIRPNGSIKVEGKVRLVDSLGNEMTLEKDVFALCRCGASSKKPFCDGSHRTCGFDGTEAHIRAAEAEASSPQ